MRISDKTQEAIAAILRSRNPDEVAYAYYRLVEVVTDEDFQDALSDTGDMYLEKAHEVSFRNGRLFRKKHGII